MFSFHKPKVYRSTTGCCICKAKSSSSRFTDSKKYEEDFIECFQLDERRTGEICNACVLLVKRWKKLPAGSNRHWRHVVDARAGPGIKSLTKFKSKNKKKMKELPEKFDKIVKKKHIYQKSDRDRENSPSMSDEMNDEEMPEVGSKGSSRSDSPVETDDIAVTEKPLISRENGAKNQHLRLGVFVDTSYFKREVYCCGIIYKGQCGEVIRESKSTKACSSCSPQARQQPTTNGVAGASPAHSSASASPVHSSASTSPAHSVELNADGSSKPASTKTFSDSSSDSGYDESSNQGLGESKLVKLVQAVKTSAQYKPVSPILAERIKQMEPPMICKPAAVASPTNPLVDFAMHASSRQSLIN